MSSVQDCCRPPCPTVPPVNVPGSPGADAFTFTTESFVIPDVNAQVVVQVLNTAGLAKGQPVLVTGPANFYVFEINGPTTVTLTFNGEVGDLGVGTIIPSGSTVLPTGNQGVAGAAGQNGYGTTTSAFTVPSVGQTVTVPVVSSSMFVQDQYVVTPGPANFIITQIPNSTSVTLQFLGNPTDVNPGVNVAAGSTIAPAGEAGGNAWSILQAQITIPAVGNTVTAQLNQDGWMTVGAVVVMPGPAHFSVTTIESSTEVVLTFLSYIGDLAPGNFIVNGSVVAPSGTQPFSSTGLASYSSGSAYVLTAIDAQMVFGTNSPQVTLPTAGTWIILSQVVVSGDIAGTTSGTVTFHLQRTNNTIGSVGNSTLILNFDGPVTTALDTVAGLPDLVYQTNTAGDIIQLWGSENNTGGTLTDFLTVNSGSIIAYRIS
jgi:hypothetical protein